MIYQLFSHFYPLANVHLDEYYLFILGSLGVYGVFFYAYNGFFAILYNIPSIMQKYKIQKNKWPDPKLIKSTFVSTLATFLVGQPIMYHAFYKYGNKMSFSVDVFPSFLESIYYIILWHIIFDTWFYFGHRLAHHERIYKYVHKMHHQYYTPIGIAAVHAHIIEGVFINMVSTLLGPFLFPSHVALFWTYLAIRYLETVEAHSGLQLPWSVFTLMGYFHGGAKRHDYHHSHPYNGNYGGYFFWDWLLGTDKHYQKMLEEEKNQKTK